jgi:hypothetical protein
VETSAELLEGITTIDEVPITGRGIGGRVRSFHGCVKTKRKTA